jgi:hypothetical protein
MLHTLILADFISLHGHPRLFLSFLSGHVDISWTIRDHSIHVRFHAMRVIQEAIEPRTIELLCAVGRIAPQPRRLAVLMATNSGRSLLRRRPQSL